MRPWIVALGRDLNPLAGAALPRHARLGWAPHLLVSAIAVVLGVGSCARLSQIDPAWTLAGVLHGVPLLACLYRPLAGVWLSLVLNPVLSEAMWTEVSLLSHLCVLAFAGWRVRPRVLLEIWILTLAAGLVLRLPAAEDLADVEEMTALSAVVLIAAGALRSRGEAWRRLAEQLDINATERKRRAVLEERSRIARELHDVLAHHMSVIAILAEAAPYRVAASPEPLTRSFATIRDHAQDALDEVRRVLGVLRAEGGSPDSQPQPSLRRLPELIAGVREAGLAVTTVVTGEPGALPSGLELSAYRIIQEGLNNVMRHAPDAAVRVDLEYRHEEVRLQVVNGPGGPGSGGAGSGHGVVGMRERVGMLRGSLEVGATPEGGYRVSAVLPVPPGEGTC
ncbi:sensor histidine kinase [Amycolatopsis pittospori]|uniref:sensor histidine kinase n=1 Tax=Amycolatopsis pittospori TaxID=2749434 RepID=UPI0015F05933|nr:histidine kinase [Amycolatopsis pittospori]